MEKRIDGYMFKGTHIKVSLLHAYIREGVSVDEFLEDDFPSLKKKGVKRVLNKLIAQLNKY